MEPEPIDEEAEIERRRKRREELLAKSSSATPLLLHAVGASDKARQMSPAPSHPDTQDSGDYETPKTPRTPASGKFLHYVANRDGSNRSQHSALRDHRARGPFPTKI